MKLEGQVLYYDELWGMLWVFDGVNGGYLSIEGLTLDLHRGDTILVEARSLPGKVEIDMSKSAVSVERPGVLPDPLFPSTVQLRDEAFNNRIVSVEGYVRSIEEVDSHLKMEVVVSNEIVEFTVKLRPNDEIPLLAESFLQVEGVLAIPLVDEDSPTKPSIFANSLDQLIVLKEALDFRFQDQRMSVDDLETVPDGRRVVVEAVIDDFISGESMSVHDQSGSIQIEIWQLRDVAIGATVEISGLVSREGEGIHLEQAVYRDFFGDDSGLGTNPWRLPVQRIDALKEQSGSGLNGEQFVRLQGIVTGVDRESVKPLYYLQDGTGAIELGTASNIKSLNPSDWIEVLVKTGGTIGGAAGIIERVLRRSPGSYPGPRSISLSSSAFNQFDDEFSELVGLVTDISPVGAEGLKLRVQNSRGSLDVLCLGMRPGEGEDWLESMIMVCGVCRKREDPVSGLVAGEILVSDSSLIKVQKERDGDPFDVPTATVSELRHSAGQMLGQRLVIRGFVSHKRRLGEVYVADRSGGIMVRLRDAVNLEISQGVEVSGFPVWEGEQLAFQRAIVRPVDSVSDAPVPLPISGFDRVRPDLIGLPVIVKGEVMDFEEKGPSPMIRLLSEDAVISVELPEGAPSFEKKSIVSATAVYLATYDEFGLPTRPRLVVSDLGAIELVESAPLLTMKQWVIASSTFGLLAISIWFWNVSLRRRVAQQLKEIQIRSKKEGILKDRFEALVESANDLIFSCDRDGSIQFFSQAGEALLGYSEKEATKLNLRVLLEPEFLESLQLLRDDSGVLASGLNRRVKFRRADGSAFWGDLGLKQLPDVSGVSGILGVVRDVSQQKEIELELQRAKNAAEGADRAKSEFLANMSHEIRTPMNGVIGMAELLLDSPLNGDQRGFVDTIRSSGEVLIKVINDILDFSKFESGKLTLDPQPFNPRHMFEHIVDSLDPEAASKGLFLSLYLPQNLPRILIGDEVRIRQVLWNLFGNAVKFTGEGGIDIRVRVRHDDVARCEFEIRDTGIGMTSEQSVKVFDPFSQADPSTTRRFGGTGLGLAICQQLVKAMDGDLQVESELGKGSCFVFALPLSVGEVAQVDELPFSVERDAALLIEDQGHVDSSLKRSLEDLGFQVVTCPLDSSVDRVFSALATSKDQVVCLVPRGLVKDCDDLVSSIRRFESEGGRGRLLPLQRRCDMTGDLDSQAERMTIRLPLRFAELLEVLLPLESGDETAPIDSKLPDVSRSRNLNVLVAEDSKLNRRVITAQLKRLGHRAILAEDGQALLDLIDTTPYDVILMDCQMPRIDGYEATRRLRKTAKHKDAKIIALTAAARDEDREKCMAAGMDDFISKPLAIERLQEVLLGNTNAVPVTRA
ncbi:ATP-binding protein [bacterium]|nr:ATP-binding protein [bacterium]